MVERLGWERFEDLETVVEWESLGRVEEVLVRVVVEVLVWLVEERLRLEREVAMRVLRVAWGRVTHRILRLAGGWGVRRRTWRCWHQ